MGATGRLLRVIEVQGEIAATPLDLDAVMALVCRRAREIVAADGSVVEIAEGDEMAYRAASGAAREYLGLRIPIEGSLAGACVREGITLASSDTQADPRVNAEACARVGALSMLCVPLRHEGRAVGVLKVYSGHPGAFDDDDADVLGLLSNLIAAQMTHATAFADRAEEGRRDALTGLGNRRAYDERLAQELARRTRYDAHLALVLFDLDGFKSVNDVRGHSGGDDVLRRVALILADSCRRADAAFRFGGDEFALILPHTTAEHAERVADRVTTRVRSAALGVTISYGVAAADSPDPRRVHDAADAALYSAKRATSGGRP